MPKLMAYWEILIMIMIWNRKEVYFGNSMKRFNEVREALALSKIKFTYRVINRNNAASFGASRARTGTLGERTDFAYEYYVYVHKKDYEEACCFI